MDKSVHTLKSQVGGFERRGNKDGAARARQELRAALLARQIAEAAPELTPDQRADLASLLVPVGGDA